MTDELTNNSEGLLVPLFEPLLIFGTTALVQLKNVEATLDVCT